MACTVRLRPVIRREACPSSARCDDVVVRDLWKATASCATSPAIRSRNCSTCAAIEQKLILDVADPLQTSSVNSPSHAESEHSEHNRRPH